MEQFFLTGIKPTGSPHIGNFFGAIKPAIELSKSNGNNKTHYFIADYHALTTTEGQSRLKEFTYEVAATWLACGLDLEKAILYKQSDIPEIFELATILSNFTPKGLMNRAHAYKAATDENLKNKADIDSGINMGLFSYPILMAADILLFNATKVPVGKDQKQHVEIARDIAQYFNNKYGNVFVIPEPLIDDKTSTIMGIDGRKMSKSYGNTVKLFASEPELKKTIAKIVTDSKGLNEPKGTDNLIFEMFKLFANKEQLAAFEKSLNSGIGWGEAKSKLFELINKALFPLREKYHYYIENQHLIDEILKKGANNARKTAKQTLLKVKQTIGVTQ